MNHTDEIAQLLQQAGHDHHKAFIETDGADAEWPLWYAEYLRDQLTPLLGVELTVSELVYALVDLDKRYTQSKPGAHWTLYYAEHLARSYGTS